MFTNSNPNAHERRSNRYLLDHRHAPEECHAVHGSWDGFPGRLRQGVTPANCAAHGHGIWWRLRASNESEALAELPATVAERTRAIRVA